MELHQLRYAREVARQGSFTAAAEVLHVSQSGVSAQIAKLERELGIRLFERGSRRATPTAEGAEVIPVVVQALAAIDEVGAVASDLAGLVRGHVRIGTVIGCTIPGYLSAFTDFRGTYPDVSVMASEGNSVDLINAVSDGSLDVALVAHVGSLPASFNVYSIVDEPLAVGVAPDHPWAGRASVTARQLSQADVLTLPAGTGVRRALDLTCAAAGVEIVPSVTAYSPDAVLALAAEGSGVTVLSRSMIAPPLAVVALSGATHARLSLITRKEPGAAARAFAQTLRTRL